LKHIKILILCLVAVCYSGGDNITDALDKEFKGESHRVVTTSGKVFHIVIDSSNCIWYVRVAYYNKLDSLKFHVKHRISCVKPVDNR